jgi:HSP20 family molecular chaperone IbpA
MDNSLRDMYGNYLMGKCVGYAPNMGLLPFNTRPCTYLDGEEYTVEFEMPGLNRASIKISTANGFLVVVGNRVRTVKSQECNYFGQETESKCVIQLPNNVDVNKASATYIDGIVTVKFPLVQDQSAIQITLSDQEL